VDRCRSWPARSPPVPCRVAAEGDASELALHPGHDGPSLCAEIRNAQPEGGRVDVEILDLTGLRGPEAPQIAPAGPRMGRSLPQGLLKVNYPPSPRVRPDVPHMI
jgi:hypothetical protein